MRRERRARSSFLSFEHGKGKHRALQAITHLKAVAQAKSMTRSKGLVSVLPVHRLPRR